MLWTDIAHAKRPMANSSLFAKFEVRSSMRSDAIVITTDRRTDRHSSNVLELRADQMSPRKLFLGVTHVLTKLHNILSMSRV